MTTTERDLRRKLRQTRRLLRDEQRGRASEWAEMARLRAELSASEVIAREYSDLRREMPCDGGRAAVEWVRLARQLMDERPPDAGEPPQRRELRSGARFLAEKRQGCTKVPAPARSLKLDAKARALASARRKRTGGRG